MLAKQLREIIKHGLIDIRGYGVAPPLVKCSPTNFGKSFKPVIDEL